jgi:hypothetical protein
MTAHSEYLLLIDKTDDYDGPDIHGPFETVREAQEYARAYREQEDIPGHENVEPTANENEAWTQAEWYFAIVEPRRDPRLCPR